MPAPVPPGFTRGPIVFIGPTRTQLTESQLLQLFWQEAGSYGARILLISCAGIETEACARYTALFKEWESATVSVLDAGTRQEALDPRHVQAVEAATGILLLGANHLRLASELGGTPLAQAIRRANARSKVVCGIGSSASFLCQHMIAFDIHPQESQHFLHANLIRFSPGLGLINRIVLVANGNETADNHFHLAQMLAAVSYNPFLIGVDLEADTGAIAYPDGTLEIFGANNALIVDGANLTYTNMHEQVGDQGDTADPISMLGMKLHLLAPEFTFDLEARSASPPRRTDIPVVTENVKSAF